jgi:hypothetical protein
MVGADDRDLARSRQALARAIEHSDFTAVERLAGVMMQEASDVGSSTDTLLFPVPARAARLASPIPVAALRPAEALGLFPETLAAESDLETCIACWCGGNVTADPLPADVHSLAQRPCPRSCPVRMRPALWDTLNVLLSRLFVSSAGLRYVPLFCTEHVLVEGFPETDPDAPSPLLQLLGLPRRRALPRAALERALRRRSGAVCERLDLDPFEFVVVCIPYDAYLRLAARRGWGRLPLWTHFDAYQLTVDLRPRAAVGGDVRYGGPDDLCSIGRCYETDHLTTRLAVVRRERFTVFERSRDESLPLTDEPRRAQRRTP